MKKFTSLLAFILALTMIFCACTPADVNDTTPNAQSTPTFTTPEETTPAATTPEETTPAETTTEAPATETTTEETTTEAPVPVVPEMETKSLKVLAIGNSFSVDAMEFLWDICNSAGIEEIVLGNLYIGGCSLDTHWSNMQTNAAAYDYYVNDVGLWTKSKQSVRYALESEEWDIITIQQVSQDSGRPETFKNLQNILNYINKYKKNPDAKIYWHMTWAYQTNASHDGFVNYGRDQMTMYNAIVNAAQGILNDYEEISGIIPSGTAVQNLRTSYIGDKLTRDGYHMSWSTGRYLTALTWFHTFTGYPVEYVEWYPDYVRAGINYAVNPDDLDAIHDAVTKAVANPFEVTVSAYAPEEVPVTTINLGANDHETLQNAGFNPDDYVALDLSYTVHAYYNSSSNSVLNTKDNSTATNIPNFNASRIFEKSDIPNGSVIIVDSGYQYRPEGWTSLVMKTASRPDNVQTSVVVVDDAWWGNYTYRAFNLSAVSTKNMTEDDCNHLRIYIPKA